MPSVAEIAPSKPRLVVVEDDRVVALDLTGTLEDLGYHVAGTATRGEDAIDLSRNLRPDLMLMDVRLAGKIDGIEAAQSIRHTSDVPIIYLTAHSDHDTLQRAADTNASGYLVKPFKAPELRCAIEIALHKHALDVRMHANEQWLATTLQSIAEAVIAIDESGNIRFFNRIAEQLTGWLSDDAREHRVEDVLELVNERNGLRMPSIVKTALERREPVVFTQSCQLHARDGACVSVEESAAPIIDRYGKILGGVLIIRDVTERRGQLLKIQQLNEALECRVKARTSQLEAANKELEAFSYSVAHDLRAPLRGIDCFSELLLQENRDNLGSTAIGYIERVRRSSSRMAALIDALLSLARVGQTEMQVIDVDLTELVESLIDELTAIQASRPVAVRVERGMRTIGDPRLLRLAIGNLLNNAWKFSSHRSDASVEVSCLPAADPPTFFVRDNGAGFDPRHAGKLFGTFQRLHTEAEFPGTGIGLAIVQRVIARHGGTVRAESRPGAGATFFFSIPSPAPTPHE